MELSRIVIKLDNSVKDDINVLQLPLIKKILNINMKQYYKNNTVSGLIDADIFIRDYIDDSNKNIFNEIYIDNVIYPIL